MELGLIVSAVISISGFDDVDFLSPLKLDSRRFKVAASEVS